MIIVCRKKLWKWNEILKIIQLCYNTLVSFWWNFAFFRSPIFNIMDFKWCQVFIHSFIFSTLGWLVLSYWHRQLLFHLTFSFWEAKKMKMKMIFELHWNFSPYSLCCCCFDDWNNMKWKVCVLIQTLLFSFVWPLYYYDEKHMKSAKFSYLLIERMREKFYSCSFGGLCFALSILCCCCCCW